MMGVKALHGWHTPASTCPKAPPAQSSCRSSSSCRSRWQPASALVMPDGPLEERPIRRVIDRVDVFADVRHASPKRQVYADSAADASCLVVRPVLTQACAASAALPYLLWLPDIDGVGVTCKRQWPALDAAFDFYMLKTMPRNRVAFDSMVEVAVAHVKAKLAEAQVERTAYLAGEGWGALLALAVASKCREINRLVLINPATSYPGSTLATAGPLLARLPPAVYKTMAMAFSPVLGDPMRIVAKAIKERLPGQASKYESMEDVLPELQALIANLPPDTLTWRLNVAAEAVKHVRPLLPGIEQRTCIIAGGKDAMLPSQQEAHKLAAAMPRAFAKVLPDSGHSLLQQKGVDLLQLLQDEGFYATQRTFTSTPPKDGGASLGPAGPVELPTMQEVARYAARWSAPMRRLSSPFFISTLQDGSLVPGLDGVPGAGCKGPIIFVGNHQILGVDMNVLVEEVYSHKGLLLRGLAHPGLMRNNHNRVGVDKDLRSIAFDFSNVIKTFGAVPVTPTNFYRLLQRQEAILLYPGGVREGFKRKNEKYKLFWPSKSEFVRMAAKFGATIVPVASIGAEDSVNIVMDTDDIRRHSFLGPIAEDFAAHMPDARVGVADKDDFDQTFIMPLAAPTVPARLYYMFRQPITLQAADYHDKCKCDETYTMIRQEVEEGISYLMRMREQDPYQSFLPRCMYENASGPQRVAPSFVPQQRSMH